MKTKSIIISGLLFIILSVTLSSYITKTQPTGTATEQYAIIDVIEGNNLSIRVTKSDSPASESVFKKEAIDGIDDYTPVLKILNQLNSQGYELLNSSLGVIPINGNAKATRNTLVMIKKIK